MLLSSICAVLKLGLRAQAVEFLLKWVIRSQLCRSSWTYRTILKTRHVIQINNIQSNRQCCIFQDCERFGQPIFCGAVNCPGRGTLRQCVAELGFILILVLFWRRAFGQSRHRPAIAQRKICLQLPTLDRHGAPLPSGVRQAARLPPGNVQAGRRAFQYISVSIDPQNRGGAARDRLALFLECCIRRAQAGDQLRSGAHGRFPQQKAVLDQIP
jgi:hypothetical protein